MTSADPPSESQEWLLKEEREGATTCILTGRVSGPTGLECVSRYPCVLWFVDEEGSKEAGSVPPNVHTAVIETLEPKDVDHVLNTLLLINPLVLPDLFCRNSILQRNTPEYNFITSRIQMLCEATLRTRMTRNDEGFTAQKNILKNLRHYIANRASDDWEGRLAEMPIAVIGSGPSLDVSVEKLAKERGKLIIFAADSALPSLHAHGIAPDATFSQDAEKPASKCIPQGLNPGLVFLSSKSPHDWQEDCVDSVFLSGNNLTEDWLSQNNVSKTRVQCMGNCGITAVNMAAALGGSPILLFGMDCATDGTGAGHAADVDQNISRGKRHNPAGQHASVPGNYQKQVKTWLLSELEQLNKLLEQLPENQEVWNITDRGAKLTQTKLVPPEALDLMLPVAMQKRPTLSCLKLRQDDGQVEKIMLLIQESLASKKDEIEIALRDHGVDVSPIWNSLISMYKDKNISMLLGTLSLKNMPHLLNTKALSNELRKEIISETQEILRLLKRFTNS